jgi:CRP/FNR family transcriptional regulator, cyclic AMP receptor protein
MPSIIELTAAEPISALAPGDVLLAEGATGGMLYVLLSGELTVERDGVKLASLTQPGTLIGEMSVLLGTPSTATVRARRESHVRTIADAANVLNTDAKLASRVAAELAARLNSTSALLVELSRKDEGKAHDQGLLARIIGALHMSSDEAVVERGDMFDTTLSRGGPV